MSSDTWKPGEPYGDPTTAPFWAACERRELTVQRCTACDHHQFYPRPFCLNCQGSALEWVKASGTGVIHSRTVTHLKVRPELDPPYTVALVDLDEGPRLLTNIVDAQSRIGDRVRVAWRERPDGPPLPVFEVVK